LTEQDSPKDAKAAFAADNAFAAANASAAAVDPPVLSTPSVCPSFSLLVQYTPPPTIEHSSITITRIIMGDILYFTKPFYFPPEKNKQEPWLTRTPHASIPVEFGYQVCMEPIDGTHWMEPIEFGYHVFLRDTQWVLKQDPLTYLYQGSLSITAMIIVLSTIIIVLSAIIIVLSAIVRFQLFLTNGSLFLNQRYCK